MKTRKENTLSTAAILAAAQVPEPTEEFKQYRAEMEALRKDCQDETLRQQKSQQDFLAHMEKYDQRSNECYTQMNNLVRYCYSVNWSEKGEEAGKAFNRCVNENLSEWKADAKKQDKLISMPQTTAWAISATIISLSVFFVLVLCFNIYQCHSPLLWKIIGFTGLSILLSIVGIIYCGHKGWL